MHKLNQAVSCILKHVGVYYLQINGADKFGNYILTAHLYKNILSRKALLRKKRKERKEFTKTHIIC